jgi:hypothetical protein
LIRDGRETDIQRKIREIWGDTKEAKDIEKVFRENDLDLFKLMECCDRKGQSILTAAGYVLAMKDRGDVLVQCECGEVMGLPAQMYKELAKLYDKGKIQCKRCDPRHAEKLMKAANQIGSAGKGIARLKLPTKDEDFL